MNEPVNEPVPHEEVGNVITQLKSPEYPLNDPVSEPENEPVNEPETYPSNIQVI